jgi:predicted lipid-binding transport protein (Tim44 family)
MTLIARLTARLGLGACLLSLTVALPVISASAPAEARAGGSYGSSSGSRSSYGGSRSSTWSSSRSYSGSSSRSGGSGGGPGPLFVIMALGFCAFALRSQSKHRPGSATAGIESQRVSSLSRMLEEAAGQDPIWREEALLQHARDAFEAVQRAWVARNQDWARDYMTPGLYARHKAQTDAMIARGERNVLDGLTISAARIIHLADRLDDDQDAVWIQFTASAEDYLVSERTGKVLKGAKGARSVFKEVWKFKRDGRQWRVDAIDLNSDQVLPLSFSERMSA